jgi:hypothetical protein
MPVDSWKLVSGGRGKAKLKKWLCLVLHKILITIDFQKVLHLFFNQYAQTFGQLVTDFNHNNSVKTGTLISIGMVPVSSFNSNI